MKKIALLIVLALAGVLAWWLLETRKKPKDETPETQPVAMSRYSAAFNHSIDTILNNYYNLTEAFVNWDSTTLSTRAKSLSNNIEKLQFDEIKKDTAIHQTAISYISGFKSDLNSIANAGDMTAKRRIFHSFSQNMYDLLRTIKYDGTKVYMQECPMAFNDTESGLWLSKTGAIRNPYLGLHHPKYKSGMLECGEVKDSLGFIFQNK